MEIFSCHALNKDLPTVSQKRFCAFENNKLLKFKDVVIIGNGPSALSMSTFLSGYAPYFDTTKSHPNGVLNKKLLETPELSIIDRDLQDLPIGLHGRSGRAVCLLYDALVRPDADLGDSNPSCLLWKKEPKNQVSHVCLGAGKIGGSWPGFRPDTLTLSFGSWLDLPAYSFDQWLADNREKLDVNYKSSDRVPCSIAAQYFADYARVLNLHEKFVFEHAVVTNAIKLTDETVKGQMFGDEPPSPTKSKSPHQAYHWLVTGFFKLDENLRKPFAYCAKRLILACGATSPKRLDICQENPSAVLYSSYVSIDTAIGRLKAKFPKYRANKFRCFLGSENSTMSHTQNYNCKISTLDDKLVENIQKCKFFSGQLDSFTGEISRKSVDCSKTDLTSRQTIDCQRFVNWHKRLNMLKIGCHSNGAFAGAKNGCQVNGIFLAPKFSAPVLVVGDGLTAADNVIRLLKAGVPVFHSFRKPVLETQRLAISRLSKSVYPRYSAIYKLMTSSSHCCLYRAYPATEVISVTEATPRDEPAGGSLKDLEPGRPTLNVATLKHRRLPGQEPSLDRMDDVSLVVSLVIISIGSEPNLRFMAQNCGKNLAVDPRKPLDPKSNPLAVDPHTGRCLNDPSVYALGPLVGDNLVRFLVGGAMAVAKDLLILKNSNFP